MNYLDYMRVAAFVVWLSVAVVRAPSIYRVLRGTGRYYDTLAALISGVGFVIASFNLRWFLPPSAELHACLYSFSIMLAIALLRVLWSYEGAAK